MDLAELKQYGYKEKIVYDTQTEILENGKRVTTETPVDSYYMKIYSMQNGWIKWKVCIENSDTPGIWNVRLTIQTIDGMDESEFESPDNTEDLLTLLEENTKSCCPITEL